MLPAAVSAEAWPIRRAGSREVLSSRMAEKRTHDGGQSVTSDGLLTAREGRREEMGQNFIPRESGSGPVPPPRFLEADLPLAS